MNSKLQANTGYDIGDFYICLDDKGRLSVIACTNRKKQNLIILPKAENSCLLVAVGNKVFTENDN